MKDKEFLIFIHNRLKYVHGENEDRDYMHKLRAVINSTPEDNETINNGCNRIDTDVTDKIPPTIHDLIGETKEQRDEYKEFIPELVHHKQVELEELKKITNLPKALQPPTPPTHPEYIEIEHKPGMPKFKISTYKKDKQPEIKKKDFNNEPNSL